MDKPNKCCNPGEFKCQIPMAIKGKVQFVDFCIAHIVASLNASGIITVVSCCGHGTMHGSIILDDGRDLQIKKFDENDYLTKEKIKCQ